MIQNFKPNSRLALCGYALAAIFSIAFPAVAQTPAQTAAAAPYPTKPIRMLVPFAAGGGTDVLARVLGEKMAVALGQPIVVDNKPGAGGIIGTDALAKSPADGHTLMLGLSTSSMINQFLYAKLPYDTQRDLTLVYRVAMGPMVLVVHPSVAAKNGPELLQYIKNNKEKLAYGSYGIGSYPHLGGAYLSESQQGGMNHIAYKGEAPMVQDLIGGQIQMAFASALAAKGHIDSGRLRAIGVIGEKRMTVLPNVPTLAEQGLTDEPYRITGWLAVAAPGGTPKAVVARVAKEIGAALQLPDVREKVVAMGFEIEDSSPEKFQAAYRKEMPVWERLVKQTGARLD